MGCGCAGEMPIVWSIGGNNVPSLSKLWLHSEHMTHVCFLLSQFSHANRLTIDRWPGLLHWGFTRSYRKISSQFQLLGPPLVSSCSVHQRWKEGEFRTIDVVLVKFHKDVDMAFTKARFKLNSKCRQEDEALLAWWSTPALVLG